MSGYARFLPFAPLVVVVMLGAAHYARIGARAEARRASAAATSAGEGLASAATAIVVQRDPRGVLALSDPVFAQSVVVPSSTQKRVSRIVAELEAHTARSMRQAVDGWKSGGGFRTRPEVDVLAVNTDTARRIRALRARAEQRIRALLSADELRRIEHANMRLVPSNPASASSAVQSLH